MEANRQFLTRHFADHLVDLKPTSILDVGCGAGHLLRLLADAGLSPIGLEPGRSSKTGIPEEARLVRADAEALPFTPRSIDWVSLRHVLHHFPRPRRALLEALRVARSGVLVAEPFFDPAHPGQRMASRFQDWLDTLIARRGAVHKSYLELADIRACLPATGLQFSAREWREERPLTPADLQESIEAARGLMPLTSEDCAAERNFKTLAERGAISLNGTRLVTIVRSAS